MKGHACNCLFVAETEVGQFLKDFFFSSDSDMEMNDQSYAWIFFFEGMNLLFWQVFPWSEMYEDV